MKLRRFLFGFLLLAVSACGEELPKHSATNLTFRAFELPDQFGELQRITFPRTNLLVITIADHKGSEQVAAWVRPLKERFPDGLPIEGVADVSSVPALLRPLVRREFKKKFNRPVMMDWSGGVVKPLACAPNVANVFVVATNGAVLLRFAGPADAERFVQLFAIVKSHLCQSSTNAVTKSEPVKASP